MARTVARFTAVRRTAGGGANRADAAEAIAVESDALVSLGINNVNGFSKGAERHNTPRTDPLRRPV